MESNFRPYIPMYDPSRSGHSSGQPPQRVPISQSMLYAYAALRGNFDKEYPHTDLLHTSLYLHPHCHIDPRFDQPINLFKWQPQRDPLMLEEPPPGAHWFQDVSCPIYPTAVTPLQQPIRNIAHDSKSLNYEEYKAQNLANYLPNHYSGNDGYANHGYVEINGYWVDPDCKREINEAENHLLEAGHVPKLPIGIGSLPLMTEGQMYAAFVGNIGNGLDGDRDGDPRRWHITPQLFARWAVGAAKGDRYVTAGDLALKAEIPDTSYNQLRPCNRPPKPFVKAQPQFDENDGSVLSGEYTPESSPSLALSARGVDMSAQPTNYCYMNPEMRIVLDRAVYDDPNVIASRVKTWLSSSADTSPIVVFRKDEMVAALAGSEHPDTGAKKLNEYSDHMNALVIEYAKALKDNAPKLDLRSDLLMERSKCYERVYFLEKRVEKLKNDTDSAPVARRESIAKVANRPYPRIEPFQAPVRNNLLQQTPTRASQRGCTIDWQLPEELRGLGSRETIRGHEGSATDAQVPDEQHRLSCQSPDQKSETTITAAKSDVSDTKSPRKLRRITERIERYFAEQENHHIRNINKTKAMDAIAEVELRELEVAVEDLKVIEKGFCEDLKIQNASEIPDLVPVRKKKPRPFDPPSEEEAGEGKGMDEEKGRDAGQEQ